MNIYFNDLNKDTQEKLLQEAGITNPKEANWDILPITEISFNNNIIEAQFESQWEDGSVVITNCKVNTDTREVTDIEIANVEIDASLDKCLVIINGNSYAVNTVDMYTETIPTEGYWYYE